MAQPQYAEPTKKRVMESLAQSDLRFLGITAEVVQPVETDSVMLESRTLLSNCDFQATDGSYLHVEFQATDGGERDLRRFQKYEALLSDKKAGTSTPTWFIPMISRSRRPD